MLRNFRRLKILENIIYPDFNLWLESARRQLVVDKESPIGEEDEEEEEVTAFSLFEYGGSVTIASNCRREKRECQTQRETRKGRVRRMEKE